MKKIVAVLAAISALAMAFALTACTSSSLGVESDGTAIHVVAKGGADGSGTGHITIESGYGLCVNHIVNKGTFHVTATDETGAVVFDKDIKDNIVDMVPVTGEIDVVIEAKGADGTIDIIAYDVEAQALADATLDDAYKQQISSTESSEESSGESTDKS